MDRTWQILLPECKYGDCMKTVHVWRVILLWRFYSKISQEIVWNFNGENMVNLITRLSPY